MKFKVFVITKFVFACSLLILKSSVRAQSIPFDTSFGVGGYVSDIIFPGHTIYGNIVWQIEPLRSDGRFVTIVTLDPPTYSMGLIRYHANGSVDQSFGNGGYAVVSLADWILGNMVIDRLGRIVIVGSVNSSSDPDWFIVVLTPAGVLDTSFGTGGVLVIPQAGNASRLTDVEIDDQNNIVTAGLIGSQSCCSNWRAIRVTPTGAVDWTFVIDQAFADFPRMTRDAAGRYVFSAVADSNDQHFGTRRILYPSGTNDTSFSGDGSIGEDVSGAGGVREVVAQSDNKVILVVACCQLSAWRYTADGTLDGTYGSGGRFSIGIPGSEETSVMAAKIDSEDRLLLGGYSRFSNVYHYFIARFLTSGTPDPTFGTNGIMNVPNTSVMYDFSLMPDGDIVMSGNTFLVRLDLGDPADLIQNPGFETADSAQPGNAQKWTGANLTKDKRTCNTISPPVTYAHTGNCAFLFKGGSGEKSQISQTINPDPSLLTDGTALTLSAWVEGAPNYILGKVVVYYTDGTKQAFSVVMGPAASYAQFTSAPFFLAKNASKFKVSFKHTYLSGKLYLDDVALIPNAARRDGVLPVPLPAQNSSR